MLKMANYFLQRAFGQAGQDTGIGALHVETRSQAFWDFENAKFTNAAVPYLSALPLTVISFIAASHVLRVRFSSVSNQWRPKWTKPFIQEEAPQGFGEEDGDLGKNTVDSFFWAIALASISILALAVQIVKLVGFPGLRLHAILLVVSWVLVALVLALGRPRYCSPSLLAFYIPALVAELSAGSWASSNLQDATHYIAALLIFASVAIILFMPLRPVSPNSGAISSVNTVPNNFERSPEDALRLWQFLTVSWVWPLLVIGKQRQMQKDDIWLLGYEFQNGRLARAFRELRGSTVFRRLLKANGIDCCILVFTSFIQIFCELSSPILLHQLLVVMESPERRKRPALTYAFLMLMRGAFEAQTATLAMWYGRRCFERSKGELIMMIYEKTMSRKVIVGLEKQEREGTNGAAVGNDGETEADGVSTKHNTDSPNGTTNGAPSRHTSERLERPTSGKENKHDDSRPAKLTLFKELFWGGKETTSKLKGPATTGQILNLVRTDAKEIAQRFREIERLIRTPFGIIFAVWLIWNLLGPSCFFAVIVLVVAQILNGIVTRLQVRWRRYSKKATDARIQINSQFIDVIRHLRWYAWHETWEAKVMAARQHELNVRVLTMALSLTVYFISVLASSIFPVAAFFAYTVLAGQKLRIDLIFPALQLFDMLQANMWEIPGLITSLLNAFVAMERIEDFMDEPEKDGVLDCDANTAPPSSMASSLRLTNCSFAWPGSTTAILRDVDLVVEPGLTVVYGKIGSGKTALLQGVLGEMDQLGGQFEIPNEMIAYCSQTPWLQGMSIRDNILFFSAFEEQRYEKVLDSCSLLPDLANFKDGDLSQIGENGIGLSGGQRARVALARAMYSRSTILLLDDPLSALDHHTAEGIVRKCFSSLLMEDRTIVLVTHRTSLVHHLANQFVEVSEGLVTASSVNPFSSDSISSGREDQSNLESTEVRPTNRKGSSEETAPQQFIDEEHREHGGIKAKVWVTFVKAGKYWWLLLFLMMAITRVFSIAQQWFFKAWGEAYNESSANPGLLVQTSHQHRELILLRESGVAEKFISLDPIDYLPSPNENLRPWLIVLLLVSIGQSLSLLLYGISQYTAVYATSKAMFTQALSRITNASFRFYDVTPAGRLMNRLTSDIQVLDTALSYFGATIFSASLFISSILVIASVSPIFFLFSAALMGVFIFVFVQFLPASRSLKRLETVSLSPLFTIFGEILQDQGLTSIRAFHAQRHFQERIVTIVDQVQGLGHFYWSVQAWLLYRYENISALSTFAMTIIALLIDLPPGMTAFMLVNAQNFIMATHRLCIRFGAMQTEFVSVERIVELLEVEQEHEGMVHPPASWPRFGGEITFDNVTIRYAPHLDPSLTNISLRIPGGSTTAVIGRTGSGKSTLAAALLNIVRAESGVITIDGIPLTDINVKTLRHRVTFVPQDPVLFLGTIRQNLDPVDEFTDEECESILSRVCDASHGQNWSLNTHVESGGRNLSQGQRQLIGITRAVLRRSPIVILDEATASIDIATSVELQRILREELSEATILTIAHRVEAVKGADYCVVLENGKVTREGSVEGDVVVDDTPEDVVV